MLCSTASNSLLSTSQFSRAKNAAVIMSEKSDAGVKIDGTTNSILNDTKNQPYEFRYAVRAHKTLTIEATTDLIGDDITVCHSS